MKTQLSFTSGYTVTQKVFYIAILIFISFSCENEKDSKISYECRFIDIACFPEKKISLTFRIVPQGNHSPFVFIWYEPSYFQGEGPFSIETDKNFILDFEIQDAGNASQRFIYEIRTDTIDSLKYDYRNRYIGKYSCTETSSYNGSTEYYTDTLTVEKSVEFNMVNILTVHDINNNYEGSKMSYLQSNSFYGYHSAVSFANDSIHYAVSGPLGFYYTNVYEGIRINQ